MPDSDERYTKAEREILEILDDLGEEPEKKRPENVVDFRKKSSRPRLSLPSLDVSGWFRTLTPAKLFLAAIVFVIAAAFARGAFPMLSTVLIIAAVMSFLSLFFVRSGPSSSSVSGPPRTKRWRGRDIEVNPGGGSSAGRGWRRFWRGPRN